MNPVPHPAPGGEAPGGAASGDTAPSGAAISGAAASVAGRSAAWWPAALAVAIGVLLAAVAVFAVIGQPRALRQAADPHRGALADPAHGDGAVELLSRRLQADGSDGRGWMLLARSYLQLNRIPDALAAYSQATTLVPGDADLWVEYANTTAIANGRRLAGEPARLVERALQIDPDNLNALAFAGMVALQAGHPAQALTHWRRLESLVAPGSDDHRRIGELIASAAGAEEGRGGANATDDREPATPTTAPVPVPSIRGTVTIAAGLAAKVAPTDTLYVFARAADGPPMPVAAVRARARGWPVSFTLDDDSAMAGGQPLSRYPRVTVVARVSRLGNPAAQPGDIEGTLEGVTPGSDVRLVLDRVIGR